MASPAVKMHRDGHLLSVLTLTPRICQVLEEQLSYTRVVQLRGEAAMRAKSHVRCEPIACFEYRKDPDHILPTRLVTGSGFLTKIAAALREAGYRPLLKDVGERPRPKAFKEYWDRLDRTGWRWGQRECVQKIARRQCGRIACPPGYGKSFLIRQMCRLWPHARIGVTTHAVDVVEQLHEDLSAFLPNVGLICGRRKLRGDRITVYSGKSLHRIDGPLDVLFVDESHEWATDDYLRRLAMPELKYARKYGFSATQKERPDEAHFELEGPFGPMIVEISYQEGVEHGCVVPIEVRWHDVEMTADPVGDSVGPATRERYGLWRNLIRNEIIQAAAREFGNEHQVLISVDTVEHAVFLKELLPEYTLCYSSAGLEPQEREWYVQQGLIKEDEPEMTPARRRQLKSAFERGELKKVIATTVWKRGVDFQLLSTLIRADGKNSPVSDYQIPGRTSRICAEAGKKMGMVLDFKDQFNGSFKRRAQDRRRNYKSRGWTQIDPPKRTSRRRGVTQALLFD